MAKFLFAAYAVTWLIHLGYLGILGLGYKRVRAELEDRDLTDPHANPAGSAKA